MKEFFRDLITDFLWWQVDRLREKHKPILIGVAGSVGKTGTKTAIAKVLSKHMKVAWQRGNYNDPISVPLVFFSQSMPNIFNPFGWFKIFIMNEAMIRGAYKFQVVVLELGVDHPLDMSQYRKYLKLDYGVLTAITPEHMANFKDLDQVAKEESVIAKFSDKLIVGEDFIDKEYLKKLGKYLSYGQGPSDARFTVKKLNAKLQRHVVITLKNGQIFELKTPLMAKQSVPALAAAALVADQLELLPDEIQSGLDSLEPVSGRMQPLRGVRGSLIIDDTYNSSPEAAIAALDTLYELPLKHKIAILGQMNELGDFSKELHEQVGKHCDPKQLDIVVTIGDHANQFLAAAAEARGCQVMRCPSPDHAADVAQRLIQKGTIILVKGSQNGVFAEEAVKELLADSEDAKKLVRQSKQWLKTKERQFAHD